VFYQWKRDPVSRRDWDDALLTNPAVDVHADDPEFGYRFIADQLHELGFVASENRVQRLCTQQRLRSALAKKRGLTRKPGPPVHDDLVDRHFTAPAVDLTWLTDITEHPTSEGKLYLCAIKDCASNRIVGYSIGPRMTADLAVSALRNAIALRCPARRARSCTRIGAPSSDPDPSSPRCTRPAWSARWAGSGPAVTTPRWNRSSRCCKRTCSTANAGTPATNYG
jgi:putative transposase